MNAKIAAAGALPESAHGRRSFAWWGMVWVIATEAAFFATLIVSYFYLRFTWGPVWPPEGIKKPTLLLPLIMSAILWSSSIPVHLAERSIKKGNQGGLRAGLAGGFVLGGIFLALTLAVEWPEKLKEFTPRTNVYGSLFFALTGFHAAHLIIGLVMSVWIQVRSWSASFSEDRHVSVQNFAMYWHFVDVVWLFIFATIYLSPRY